MSIAVIEARKNNAFQRMQTIFDLSKKIGDERVRTQFCQKAKTISMIRQEFSENLDKFHELKLVESDSYVVSYASLDAFDDMYSAVNALYSSLEEKRLQSRKVSEPAGTVVQPRLPKLQIPDFNGNQEDWPVFFQLFKRLIHDNKNISKLEKINYLVSHLQGSAKSICCGILPTEENYDALFTSLVERYDDKRALAVSYLDKLLNFKPLTTESEKSLTAFLEKFVEATTALKNLEIPDLCDFIFTHIALKKLDSCTVKHFEMNFRKNEIPTFDLLVKFTKEQAKILNRTNKTFAVNNVIGNNAVSKKTHNFMIKRGQSSPQNQKINSGQNSSCNLCKEKEHPFYFCSVFRKMSVPDRWVAVKRNRACFNCLSPNKHIVDSCQSSQVCNKCGKRHHSLLHSISTEHRSSDKNSSCSVNQSVATPSISEDSLANKSNSKENENSAALVHCASAGSAVEPHMVLLATAIVLVHDDKGMKHQLRALLDPGSQSHFITKETCDKLNLGLQKTEFVIKSIGSNQLTAQCYTRIKFHSIKTPHTSYCIDAIVVETLTDMLPSAPVCVENLTHLKNLSLADRRFHIPGKIDLLIGAELWPTIVGTKKILGPPNSPVALESSLGYLVLGRISRPLINSSSHNFCTSLEPELSTVMEKFWSLDQIAPRVSLLPEEEDCEKQFLEQYKRLPDGRFSVALPFKRPASLLGSSKELAIAKFVSLERRLLNNPDFHLKYNHILEDYLEKGYLTSVSGKEELEGDSYFMPHHAVVKHDSRSTPLRIVFNASAPTSNGCSLNDILHVGPKLQTNIFDILLNFRLLSYALTTDISKMYLQILIHPTHRKYQRLVWRPSPTEDIQFFELNRVTFGVASSPYLAQRVVRILASIEELNFPTASRVTRRDTYIDDIVTSMQTEEETLELFRQLNGLFNAGGFSLAKWCTNSPLLNQILPTCERDTVSFDEDDSYLKVLGLRWLPSSDEFLFKMEPVEAITTKRGILSTIAKIFDPLGLLAPVLTFAKLIMKSLWELHLDWDATPSEDILRRWNLFLTELPDLSRFRIPRHCLITTGRPTRLVGFADACEKAYGAVVYIWTENASSNHSVRLLCAKSKIAPSKSTMTIPRLELCAALLLSKLMRHIINLYIERHKFYEVVAFSDSTVVLHWINSSPARWKVFVANRISQLQENLDSTCWRHVKGEDNPADCLSRGLMPSALVTHSLWLQGPPWLVNPPSSWPIAFGEEIRTTHNGQKNIFIETVASEERHSTLTSASFLVEHPLRRLINKFSSYTRLLRSTVYVMRFMARNVHQRNSPISGQEIELAERWLVQIVQQQHFSSELILLKKNQECSSQLKKLCPFLDKGLLRVGGRLTQSTLSYEQKHPFLLPKNDHFIHLLIDDCHQKNLHTGPSLVLSLLRQKFWILSARGVVRNRLRKCNFCFKRRPQSTCPLMGDLPTPRVTQSKPFLHTGVDYAGPFQITWSRRRGVRSQKAYLCLFVCFSTKAVHLELASDLSTQIFLCAFKRFYARRGPVQVLYSDCGTNFIGAQAHLSNLHSFIQSKKFVDEFGVELSTKGIEWKFNPPSAPHFGGLWESAVKSAKSHLHRIINNRVLSYEEFSTVLTQIEALLNSRPLFALSSDPRELAALTPAHFLLQQPLSELPAADVSAEPLKNLTRFQFLDQLVQDFWKRWHLEYLHNLQTREKWNTSSNPVKPGLIVIIKQDNCAPLTWPIGIIESCFPGPDNIVRVVNVRTKNGVFRRPVTKLCPLPSQ